MKKLDEKLTITHRQLRNYTLKVIALGFLLGLIMGILYVNITTLITIL